MQSDGENELTQLIKPYVRLISIRVDINQAFLKTQRNLLMLGGGRKLFLKRFHMTLTLEELTPLLSSQICHY